MDEGISCWELPRLLRYETWYEHRIRFRCRGSELEAEGTLRCTAEALPWNAVLEATVFGKKPGNMLLEIHRESAWQQLAQWLRRKLRGS